MRERKQCEAVFHSIDCSGRGSTKDHFTPRCIGKLFHIGRRVHRKENIQYLSKACHRDKDYTTPFRLGLTKKQVEKEVFRSLDDYRERVLKRERSSDEMVREHNEWLARLRGFS